jgi:hypothetical protein
MDKKIEFIEHINKHGQTHFIYKEFDVARDNEVFGKIEYDYVIQEFVFIPQKDIQLNSHIMKTIVEKCEELTKLIK